MRVQRSARYLTRKCYWQHSTWWFNVIKLEGREAQIKYLVETWTPQGSENASTYTCHGYEKLTRPTALHPEHPPPPQKNSAMLKDTLRASPPPHLVAASCQFSQCTINVRHKSPRIMWNASPHSVCACKWFHARICRRAVMLSELPPGVFIKGRRSAGSCSSSRLVQIFFK